jgi:anti-sigma-K factor RskA
MTDEPFHDDPALTRLEGLLRAAGPPPVPSDELRERLLRIPQQEPRRPLRRTAPAPAWRKAWGSLAAWRVAAAGLAVAAVILAVVAITGGSTGVAGRSVALTSAPEYQASGEAVSLVKDGTRRIRVRIDGLPPLPGDDVYELWIAKDKTHRISLGVFKASHPGALDVTVSVPDLGPEWRGVWLTRERGGGAPGWSHDWVVAGRLA